MIYDRKVSYLDCEHVHPVDSEGDRVQDHPVSSDEDCVQAQPAVSETPSIAVGIRDRGASRHSSPYNLESGQVLFNLLGVNEILWSKRAAFLHQ